MKIKTIVILGAGFGGVRVSLTLEKLTRKAGVTGIRIVLIDKNRYHTFVPALYEIASAAPQISEDTLYHRVNILIKHLLKGKNVEFIKADVAKIDVQTRTLHFKGGNGIEYNYLVLACGAQTNFSGIEGLKEHSLDLKDFLGALKIRRAVKLADEVPKTIIIGGGGTTGVELTAELATCFYNHFPADQASQIILVNGQERILSSFPEKVSHLAAKRLKTLGVNLVLEHYIKKVDDTRVLLDNGESLAYERLFWTGGIQAQTLIKSLPFQKEKGFLKVEGCLHPISQDGKSQEDIFALGDVSVVYDKRGKLIPWTAQKAMAEGKQVAYNILRLLTGKEKHMCPASQVQFIIPVGGKWAITKLNGVVHSGFLGWVLKNLVELRYLLSILPWWRAITKWLIVMRTFTKND